MKTIKLCIFPILFLAFLAAASADYWLPTELVSWYPTNYSTDSTFVDIELGPDGTLHAVWRWARDSCGTYYDCDTLYSQKPVGGEWSDPIKLFTETPDQTEYPDMVVDGFNNIHVIFNSFTNYSDGEFDRDALYKRKLAGQDWEATVAVSTPEESRNHVVSTRIAVDINGTVHIVFTEEGNYSGNGNDHDVLYKRKRLDENFSCNMATMEGCAETVSVESTGNSQQPVLFVDDDGYVHVAWRDSTNINGAGTDYDIFYKRRTPNAPYGAAWTPVEVVSTESTRHGWYPYVFVDSFFNVHLAWDDHTFIPGDNDIGTNYTDIFYKVKPYGGGWSPVQLVSNDSSPTAGDTRYPSLYVVDRTVYITYTDYTPYTGDIDLDGNQRDIFMKTNVEGSGWSAFEPVSTESTKEARNSQIIVTPERTIYTAWHDLTENISGIWTDLWDFDIFAREKVPAPDIMTITGDVRYQNGSIPSYATVEVYDETSGDYWNTTTTTGTYSVSFEMASHNLRAGDILWFFARDDTVFANRVQHIVNDAEINALLIVKDITLSQHYRDLKGFPYHQAEASTGAATARMVLNYLYWNQTAYPAPPDTYPSEAGLLMQMDTDNDTLLSPSELAGGFNRIIDDANNNWRWGYFFSQYSSPVQSMALAQIPLWIDYPVSYYNGQRLIPVPPMGHTDHVPVAVPLYGSFSRWAAVKGIHTNRPAWPPTAVTIHGLWLSDPAPGGLGQNTYVTASRFASTYYLLVNASGEWQDRYVVVIDPPRDVIVDTAGAGADLAQARTTLTSREQKALRDGKRSEPLYTKAAFDAAMGVLGLTDKAGVYAKARPQGRPKCDAESCMVSFASKKARFDVLVARADGSLLEIRLG